MGLDLYFEKRRRKDTDAQTTEELAYFRKVNLLISYFEKYFDVEMGNCKYYPITKQYCIDLVDTCKEVLANHESAEELLPTEGGFFFGSTEYDRYYFEDLEGIIEQLTKQVIPEFDNLKEDEDISFYIWY